MLMEWTFTAMRHNIKVATVFQMFANDFLKSIIALIVLLALVYSPVFMYPYLLADETWLIGSSKFHLYLGMCSQFGRYLFFPVNGIFNGLFHFIGLDAVYVVRAFAIVWFALSGFVLVRWFRLWGQGVPTAYALTMCILTLPSYQIIVANGTQLAPAIFFTIYGTYCFFAPGGNAGWRKTVFCSGCLLVSLLIYQQQVLLAIAMLAVPLLAGRTYRDWLPVMRFGGLVTALSASYYIVWKFALYPLAVHDKINERYGPNGIHLPGKAALVEFATERLVQVANLWNVHPPQVSLITYGMAALILTALLTGPARMVLLRCVLFVLLVVGADFFRLAAGAYPSYITSTGLTFLVFFCAYAGFQRLLKRISPYAAIALACYGCFMAFATTRQEIALPNNFHMQQIRTAVLENPGCWRVRVDFAYRNNSSAYQEFQWRNAGVFLFHASIAIFEDLAKKHLISQSQLQDLNDNLSIGGEGEDTLHEWMRRDAQSNSVVVNLCDVI